MEPGTETDNASENTGNQEQNQGGEQNETVGALSALSSFMNPKTVEEIQNLDKKPENTEAKADDKKPGQTEEKPEGDKAGEKKPAETKSEGQEPKSVLGLNTKKTTKAADQIIIENPEQILDVVKKDFGQEYKGIEELPKFFESAKKWRNDSQAYEKTKSEYDNILSVLENTPEELIEGIKLFHSGEDYMKAFQNRPAFNFDLPAEKQDVNALVKHYYPNEFADEDFNEGNESSALKIAKQASIDKYNYTKTARDNERVTREQNASKQLESMKSSVSGSVNYLKQSFPDADQDVISDISNTLEGGIQKVAELIYNNDGTVKPEAAEMLMMMKHGKSEISRMMKIAANQAESQANEDLVTRGADTKKPVKTGQTADKISEGAMEQLKALSVFREKKTF